MQLTDRDRAQPPRTAPLRVLVVDDSVVVRRLVEEALSVDPAVEVVGVAANGRIALRRANALRPDAVTLDVEMPELDGVETARALRQAFPDLTIVMYAAPSDRTARATLAALEAGADDYVLKPTSSGAAAAHQAVLAELVPRIKALAARRRRRPVPPSSAPARPASPAPGAVTAPVGPALAALLAASGVRVQREAPPPQTTDKPRRTTPYSVLLVGASTGGPDALAKVVAALPARFDVPVVIVQHMPPMFTRLLAERLDALTPLTVREAQDGDVARPGVVLLAPGGRHLELHRTTKGLQARLTDGPQENFCRPAVDVLFRTGVQACGDGVLAAVLTGMGRDGEKGCRLVQAARGGVVAQDEATSVVWGMPGAVVTSGLADRVVPLPELGAALVAEVRAAGRGHEPRGS